MGLHQNLQKLGVIGKGSAGTVYKVKDLETGELFAVKETRLGNDGVPQSTLREIFINRMLPPHVNIARLLDVKSDGFTLNLFFQFMDMDLSKKIWLFSRRRTKPEIPEEMVKSLLHQLCSGLAFCHAHGVLHRDLKPSNILVDSNGDLLKIADLGLCRPYGFPISTYTPDVTTGTYRAPEVLLGATHYSTAVDMWAVGCIFAELCRNRPLFPGRSDTHQISLIFKLLGTPNERIWPGVTALRKWRDFEVCAPRDLAPLFPKLGEDGLDLLQRMLCYKPGARISAKGALAHAYFDGI